MNRQLLRQIAFGILALTPALASLPARAEDVREGTCAGSQELFPDSNPGPGSLKALRPHRIPELDTYIRDRRAAIALGKALFWDMQVGSDGIQACGSCHFRAGADPRSINQANPGGANNPDLTVNVGINHRLSAADFPLHKLADPTLRNSQVLRDNDDVISSQGVKLSRFVRAIPGADKDVTVPVPDEVFNINGLNTRRAEPRNTPTVINSAFNRDAFWDGRAETIFNGVSVFGVRDPNARVLKASGDSLSLVKIRIDHAALASQAVGPPLSDREMGSLGRTFYDVGKRLVSARPLAKQKVDRHDSVLAPYRNDDGRDARGLEGTYGRMIEAAFQKSWWRSDKIAIRQPDGSTTIADRPNRRLLANEYTMKEYNFSLYFGLAVQLYETTLISDDSPVDRYFEGDSRALTAQQVRGLAVFTGDAACAGCHSGAETSDNSNRILTGAVVDGVRQPAELVERMFNGNCEVVAYDQSYYNLSVRPFEEDSGLGTPDPFGNPGALIDILTKLPSQIPSAELLSQPMPNIANPAIAIGERTSTRSFKTPLLRNIELTAPYFHNGGQATLLQVVNFYNRGGDFREHNSEFIDFEIGKLNLTPDELDDLVAFLKGLTDQRVVYRKAPFDAPQLFVPNGHRVVDGVPVVASDGTAADILMEVPAVGRNGGPPLKAFLKD
ncbi:MAG TPA: cytochrome c peroxidase [Steroidobacteraceae bacterium]|nr:cytochrome c peroxidase [Steroidobacteraceae bacterium]